jgi:hypothetical protein
MNSLASGILEERGRGRVKDAEGLISAVSAAILRSS